MPEKFKLASWTLLSSFINFASSFVLATIYDVSAFGFYAQALAISTLGSFIFSFRADLFSVEDETFNELVVFSTIILFLVIPASFLYEDGYILSIWSYSISLFSICTYKSISNGNQLTIGYFRCANVVFIIFSQVIFFYFFGLKEKGLYFGAAVGSIITSGIYTFKFFDIYKVNKDKITLLKSRYRSYLSATISWLLDNIILFTVPIYGIYSFTIDELGFFNFADRFFKAPVGVLVSSIVPFFIGSLAKRKTIENSLLLKHWLKILIILIPVMMVIVCFLPMVFSYIWGDKWILSINYIIPLAVFYIFYILSSSTAYIYVKKDKYHYYTVIQLSLVLSTYLIYLYTSGDLEQFYKLFVISYSIFQILNLLTQLKISHDKDPKSYP